MRLIIVFLFFIMMSGCTQYADVTKKDCVEIVGFDDILDNPDIEIIVIGEVHGMTAPPQLAEAMICHSLQRGDKTLLALEMTASNQMQEYLKSDGSESAQMKLFEEDMWDGEFTDGRSSEDMFLLVDQARLLKQGNVPFAISLFVPSREEQEANWGEKEISSNERNQIKENLMATKILSAKNAFSADRVIVLTGNIHASHARYERGGRNYDLMGVHLPPEKTLTLNTLYQSGTSWSCRSASAEDCKTHDTMGSVSENHRLARDGCFEIMLWDEGLEIEEFASTIDNSLNYDGLVYIGKAEASPPAYLRLQQ